MLFVRNEFVYALVKRHAKYRKLEDSVLTVIVPVHEKDLRYGTFRSILRQSKF